MRISKHLYASLFSKFLTCNPKTSSYLSNCFIYIRNLISKMIEDFALLDKICSYLPKEISKAKVKEIFEILKTQERQHDGTTPYVSTPDLSTPPIQLQDFSTPRPYNSKTLQLLDFTTPRLYNPIHFNSKTLQPQDFTTPRLFNSKTLQPQMLQPHL